MKRTVLTEKLPDAQGGQTIVKGFDFPVIDPHRTREKVAVAIRQADESRAFSDKRKAIENECKMAGQSRTSEIAAKKNNNIADAEKHHSDYLRRFENASDLMNEMLPLKRAYNQKLKSLRKSQAIFFTPRNGEEILENNEMATLSEKYRGLNKNQVLLRDGSVKSDFVGVEYWKKSTDGKWSKNMISQIGKNIPTGGKRKEDLTQEERAEISEQLNLERISKLSSGGKESEKLQVIDSLAGQAASMRSKLEIQNDSAALTKSQDWYNVEVAKLDEVYG